MIGNPTLIECQTKNDYQLKTVTLNGISFKIIETILIQENFQEYIGDYNSGNDIRDSHLNEEEKSALREIIKEFESLKFNETKSLTSTSKIKHIIKTTTEEAVYKKPYPYPQIFEEEVNNK